MIFKNTINKIAAYLSFSGFIGLIYAIINSKLGLDRDVNFFELIVNGSIIAGILIASIWFIIYMSKGVMSES